VSRDEKIPPPIDRGRQIFLNVRLQRAAQVIPSCRMKYAALPLLMIVWSLGACAPNTPEQRIAQSPAVFEALPAKQQTLVRQGELSRGMSPDAVILAWGAPSRRYSGVSNGTSAERWDYMGSQPVYGNTIGFGGWGGMGGWNRWGGYGCGAPFLANDIAFIPYRRATVLFKNQRVEAWEKMQ
jgi:hypothetical protein